MADSADGADDGEDDADDVVYAEVVENIRGAFYISDALFGAIAHSSSLHCHSSVSFSPASTGDTLSIQTYKKNYSLLF